MLLAAVLTSLLCVSSGGCDETFYNDVLMGDGAALSALKRLVRCLELLCRVVSQTLSGSRCACAGYATVQVTDVLRCRVRCRERVVHAHA
jgi:hypothetical protein